MSTLESYRYNALDERGQKGQRDGEGTVDERGAHHAR